MVECREVKQTQELTLLALGEDYALLGDDEGCIRRACPKCFARLKTINPRRLYIEEDAELLGIPVASSYQAPKDRAIVIHKGKDEFSGLGFRGAYDPAEGAWYVSELRDPVTRKPTGRFFFTSNDSLHWED